MRDPQVSYLFYAEQDQRMTELLNLYRTEMNRRVAGVRASIAALPPVGDEIDDPYATFYNACLDPHAIKGTSLQLQFPEAAQLGGQILGLLRTAQELGQLDQDARDHIVASCNALETWLASPSLSVPPITT